MFLLQVPGSYIVDNSVSIHIFHRVFRRNIAASLANDDSQFPFIIHRAGNIRVTVNGVIRPDDRGSGLGEEHRIFRYFCLGILFKFFHMRRIILSHTENVPLWIKRNFYADFTYRNGFHRLILFVHFQHLSQIQKSFFAHGNKFFHGFCQRYEIRFFQFHGRNNRGAIGSHNAPLPKAFIVE